MKRIFALVMVLVMCVSLVGFKSDTSAFETYRAMQQALENETKFSVRIDATVIVDIAGTELEMTMQGNMKEIVYSDTDMDLAGSMTVTMLGEEVTTEMYYTDGYMYYKMADEKFKIALDLDEAQEQAMMNGTNVDVTKGMFESSFVADTENGRELTMIIGEEYINSFMGDYMDSLMSTLETEDDEAPTFKLSPIRNKIILAKDNTPISQHMNFSMTTDVEGEAFTMTYDMSMYYRTPTFTSITFPSDLASYELAE